MSHQSGRQVIFRLVSMKLRRGRINAVSGLILPAVVLLFWIKGSFDAAGKAFLFLLPHIFLFLSQDMAKDDIRSGALENVLFLEKGYKAYLLGKNRVLILIGTLYAVVLFIPLWSWGLISHGSNRDFFLGFLAALLIGVYYIGLGGFLSYFFKAGSNVLALIVAQAGTFMVLIYSAARKDGLLDILETGSMPGFASKIKFLALTVILPNVVVAAKLRKYSALIAVLALAAFLLQKLIIRNVELRRS